MRSVRRNLRERDCCERGYKIAGTRNITASYQSESAAQVVGRGTSFTSELLRLPA